MANETRVRPALTSSEWHDLSVEGDECVALDQNGDMYFAGMGRVAGYMRHQIAALALFGQPFGFTPDDVEVLMGAAMRIGQDAAPGAAEFYRPRLTNIARRIRALLPPDDASEKEADSE